MAHQPAVHARVGNAARRETCPPISVGRLSLRRNFTWTLAGNIVNAGCQWGVLVELAKLGSPEMVGQLVLGLAIATPIVTFANLQLRAIQATDAREEGCFGHYLALRLLTTALAMAAVAAVAVLGGYRREVTWVILLVGLSRGLEALGDVFHGLFQQRERMDRIALSMIAKGVLTLVLFGLGIWLFGGILAGLWGLVLARVVTLLGVDLTNALGLARPSDAPWPSAAATAASRLSALRPCWDGPLVLSLAGRALPLGVTLLLLSLSTSIPRLFVERYFGEHALGVFASMAYFMVVGTTVVMALGQAASPRLAQYYFAQNRAAFHRLLGKMVLVNGVLATLLVAAAVVAGREILTWCYRPEYAERLDVFVLVMIAAALSFLAAPLGYAATASRRIHSQLVAAGAITLIALGTSVLWIPVHGLSGAAWSLVATSAATLIVYGLLFSPRGCLT